jgi:hypothetical protein
MKELEAIEKLIAAMPDDPTDEELMIGMQTYVS